MNIHQRTTLNARYRTAVDKLKELEFIPLVLIRLTIAYGFISYNILPWMNGLSLGTPTVSGWLLSFIETLAIILIVAGVATRLVSTILLFTFLLSFTSYQWPGSIPLGGIFEVPLYHILLLLSLIVFGAGKVSVDYWIQKSLARSAAVAQHEIKFARIEERWELLWGYYEDF